MAYEDEEPKARRRTGPKARGKTEAANRAARAYLEEGLGWLRGYPTAGQPAPRTAPSVEGGDLVIPWRAPGKGGSWRSVTVDRELLRTSFYTLRGAKRKFPYALERVVGDLDLWTRRQEARLRQVQRAVHDDELLLPPSPTPSNGLDFRADLEWLAWGDAAEQARTQAQLRQWGAVLAQVQAASGLDLTRRFALEVLIAPQDLAALERLRPILSTAAAFSLVTQPGDAADIVASIAGKAERKLVIPDSLADISGVTRPADVRPFGAQVVEFLLSESDPLTRELVLCCLSPARYREWERWWEVVESCGKDARKLRRILVQASANSAPTKAAATQRLVKLLKETAQAAHQSLPKPMGTRPLVETVKRGRKSLSDTSTRELLRCLSQLPDAEGPSRITAQSVLESATQHESPLTDRRRAILLKGLAKRLESAAGLALSPAQRLRFASLATEDVCDFCWGANDVPWTRREVVLDAALQLCSADVSDDWMKKLETSWQIVGAFEGYAEEVNDPARLAALVLQNGEEVSWDVATVSARFACERDPSAAGTVAVLPFTALRDTLGDATSCKAWGAAAERDSQGISQLAKLSRAGVLRKELRQAAAAGIAPHELTRFAALFARARRDRSLRGTSVPDPLPLDQDTWADFISWIPEPLHPAAERFLAHASAGALPKALGPNLVDPRALIAERAAIENKLSAEELPAPKRSALELRRANLAERIDRSGTLAHEEFERIAERLHSGAVRARFRRWLGTLQDSALAQLPPAAREAIDLSEDRHADLVVAGLGGLPANVRELSHRLLALRSGPKPWDLRDDPINIAWRARATEHGLDLARWFSDAPFEVPTGEGPTLRYALEDDPLEVMKMGLWFDTCLSPGDFNFFSTVANAADANKRVLVARDGSGTAQARCLFAITERWHLLAFHVYAHERRDEVTESIKNILQQLSSALGATPAPRGRVATLVAPKWYDDGPHDVTDQLGGLRPDGEVAKRLESAHPEDAFGIVVDALGAPLVEVALEPILSTIALQGSAARTASFAPMLTTHRLPRDFAISLIARLSADAKGAAGEVALELAKRLCKGKSPARLNLQVHAALSLARSYRRLGQPEQSLKLLRGRRDSYEAAEIQRETAWALTAMGLDHAAARIWHTLSAAGDPAAIEHLKSTGNLR